MGGRDLWGRHGDRDLPQIRLQGSQDGSGAEMGVGMLRGYHNVSWRSQRFKKNEQESIIIKSPK